MMDWIRKHITHERLGWGYPASIETPDVIVPTFTCRFCDHIVTVDSTGAWFHLSRKQEDVLPKDQARRFCQQCGRLYTPPTAAEAHEIKADYKLGNCRKCQ